MVVSGYGNRHLKTIFLIFDFSYSFSFYHYAAQIKKVLPGKNQTYSRSHSRQPTKFALAALSQLMLLLYIEDNYADRLFVRRVLEAMGHQVAEAETGLEGLLLAADRRPDLILLDIHLPGMSSLETAAKLKQVPRLAHIPVIALTVNVMKGERERWLAAGCDDYLEKPAGVSELRRIIQRYSAGQ
jgi:two-component system cell cycle response regulator DivK